MAALNHRKRIKVGRFVWHRRGEIVGHTPVDEEIKDGWYFELVGRDIDISHLTTEFPGEPHRTLHIEGKPYLRSLRFAAHNELRTVREEALELIGMLNRSLGAVAADFNPVRIGDVVVQIVDGTRPPKIYVRVGRRMREESVPLKVLLMNMEDDEFAEAAASLANRPTTWSDLFITFETIAKKIGGGNREGHQVLLEREWLSAEEAESFSRTAQFFCRGSPREPIVGVQMSLADADALIRRLFSQLVMLKYAEWMEEHSG